MYLRVWSSFIFIVTSLKIAKIYSPFEGKFLVLEC